MDIYAKDINAENCELSETPNESPPAIDAIIHVSVVNGGLEAYLSIEPPSNDGAGPTLKALKAALSDFGVSYNIDSKKLEAIEAEPVYNSNILIASGVAPHNGINGTASFQFNTEHKNLKPKECEDGKVNYHDLDIVENVTKGQVLCIITPPTEGTPGMSVRGKVLPQKKGRPVQSCLGKNTELNEDGTAVLSKINGEVEFIGGRINVNETFYVKENVDNSTGDIKVSCDLVVPGIVWPGFKIEAGGNITIRGAVEGSTVKAGGNINLQSGITGSQLHCNGDLKCRFIENSNVFVKGEISAEHIINSDIKCGKSIKLFGSKAKIIGGNCIAGQNIEANTIGSLADIKTRLELGTDHTVIERQQELLSQTMELEEKNKKLVPLITILSQLEALNRLTPDKKEALENVNYSYEVNMALLEEIKRELDEISELIKKRGYGRIICTDTIYPHTQVFIGKANYSVTNTLNNVSLFYDQGNICIGTAR